MIAETEFYRMRLRRGARTIATKELTDFGIGLEL
jgi:hypothetical protein